MSTPHSPDPLRNLYDLVAEAATLPPAEPYQPSADPLRALSARVSGEEVAEAEKRPPPDAGSSPAGGDPLEATIGREVLALVASRPLSPAARAEAVRRAALAASNPSSQNVRSVLAVLLSDNPDS